MSEKVPVNDKYSNMRVIQERDSNNVPTVAYTRGTDLSGSMEGGGLPRQSGATAGGIGGLLARSGGGVLITNTTLDIYLVLAKATRIRRAVHQGQLGFSA